MTSFALVGKLPSHGDFVRVGVTEEAQAQLFRWLVEAHALTSSEGRPLTTAACFALGFGAEVAVGVMVPSADAVGRRFPLAAVASVPVAEVGARFPALPGAWDRVLHRARLLLEGGETDPERLWRALAGTGEPLSLDEAWEGAVQGLSSVTTVDFHDRLFGPAAGAPCYAYQTLRAACSGNTRGRVVSCPVGVHIDAFVWLELCRRLLPGPPSFLWTAAGAGARLLVALDGVPAELLSWVGRPDADPARLWPLETDRPAALERAERLLGPVVPARQEPVSALLDAVARRTR